MTYIPDNFGNALRSLRNRAGLTLRDVAEHLGCSITYLSNVELAQRWPPSNEIIAKLADLLTGEDEPLWGTAEEQLFEAAARTRGRFELSLRSANQADRDLAAAMARFWRHSLPGEREALHRSLGRWQSIRAQREAAEGFELEEAS